MGFTGLLVRCGAVALALAATVGTAPAAWATYDPAPTGPIGWVPDGPVLAVAVSGDRVFVGGGFTGGVAALDASTGALQWTGHTDGQVRALAVSSDGTHLIIGGGFSTVDGATHRRLASLQVADGAAEPAWKARAGGMVRDIVVQGDTAYFGGTFLKHDGIDQQGLGAVSVSTGRAVTAFNATTNAKVYALATDGNRLYVGGDFTAVNGSPRSSLAAVDLDTQALDPWNPPRACSSSNSDVACNVYWDVVTDGAQVYVATRNGGAATAFDAVTGARNWRVTANGDAQALALGTDGLLYVGGHFTTIGSTDEPRTILAALSTATGAIDPDFTPHFVKTYPGIWALAATSTHLYAGGYFTSAGTSTPKRFPYFAMFG